LFQEGDSAVVSHGVKKGRVLQELLRDEVGHQFVVGLHVSCGQDVIGQLYVRIRAPVIGNRVPNVYTAFAFCHLGGICKCASEPRLSAEDVDANHVGKSF
jgi:hypothetical protein